MTDRTMRTLQRRLARMELEHLRQHALELYERLERSEVERDEANQRADFWQEHAHELQCALYESGAGQVGITQSGELLVMPAPTPAEAA